MAATVAVYKSSSPEGRLVWGSQRDTIPSYFGDWYDTKYVIPGKLSWGAPLDWGAAGFDIEFVRNIRYEEIVEQFVSDVSKIPQVVRVEVLQDDEGIDIWTFIEERDPAVRTKIHECQFRLLERFPHLGVDFHVVSNPQRSFYGTREIYSKAH